MRRPIRTCIGCRRKSPVASLARVARDPTDGSLRVDREAPGRGAWLCAGAIEGVPAAQCLETAVRRQAFGRAFRAPVDGTVVGVLREELEERARIVGGGAAAATGQRRD